MIARYRAARYRRLPAKGAQPASLSLAQSPLEGTRDARQLHIDSGIYRTSERKLEGCRMRTRLWWLICLPLVVAGCASYTLPAGTLILAQVAHVATKDEMAHGVKVDEQSLLVPPYLLNRCTLDAGSLENGDLAIMRLWISSASESYLSWVVVPKGMVVAPGDFVDVELKPGFGNQRCPCIARVRSPSTANGECRLVRSQRGSTLIYCKGLEEEGWAKYPAPDVPSNEAVIWRKVP